MSLIDEPEVREEDELDRDVCHGEDVQAKGFLKTSRTEKRSISPLTLLREDLSQFKDDVLKVFKDKDTNPTTSQPAEKPINPLSLLRDDFSQFKDDFSQFKDDFTSVFRISLSKERDDSDEDTSNAFTIKASRAERTEEPLKSLFRRSLLKTSLKAETGPGVTTTLREKSDDQTDDGLRRSFSEQNEETADAEKSNTKDGVKGSDGELDSDVSEDKTETTKSFCETQQSEEATFTPTTARYETDEWRDDDSVVSGEEEEEEGHPLDALYSEITLFSLRDANQGDLRNQPGGDPWSLKNFACYLTLDPNTANSELHLTEGNRKATRVWSDHRSSDHPERFERCPQVLCREGLLDSVYWEVVWSGGADIGVAHNNISRDGDAASCLLGHNERSWSLECSEGRYTPCHNGRRFRSSSPEPFARRVGVYLDWTAGSLSFYCVSQDTMEHLHTFTSAFNEPLYPGFWVWAYDGSVSLCQVELDWERLLQ